MQPVRTIPSSRKGHPLKSRHLKRVETPDVAQALEAAADLALKYGPDGLAPDLATARRRPTPRNLGFLFNAVLSIALDATSTRTDDDDSPESEARWFASIAEFTAALSGLSAAIGAQRSGAGSTTVAEARRRDSESATDERWLGLLADIEADGVDALDSETTFKVAVARHDGRNDVEALFALFAMLAEQAHLSGNAALDNLAELRDQGVAPEGNRHARELRRRVVRAAQHLAALAPFVAALAPEGDR